MEKIKKLTALILNKITSITQVFGILAIGVGVLLLIYDARYLLLFGGGWDYINNIIVEAHGLFFDLLVLGVLISIYERRRQKKDAIERDENLINDYRGWNEKEAMYRIVGAIKRLNEAGMKKLDLRSCFLSEAKLTRSNLRKANLTGADLSKADLTRADLTGADLAGADLSGADLWKATLTKANLQWIRLSGTTFTKADLTGANLRGVNLIGTILWETNCRWVDLLGATVPTDWFEKLKNWRVKGREEIIAKYYINEMGKLQLK